MAFENLHFNHKWLWSRMALLAAAGCHTRCRLLFEILPNCGEKISRMIDHFLNRLKCRYKMQMYYTPPTMYAVAQKIALPVKCIYAYNTRAREAKKEHVLYTEDEKINVICANKMAMCVRHFAVVFGVGRTCSVLAWRLTLLSFTLAADTHLRL